jgi:hypothetical protein
MDKKEKALRMKVLQAAVDEFGYETDNDGQIVIYTGYYETEDGDISEEPQDVELE